MKLLSIFIVSILLLFTCKSQKGIMETNFLDSNEEFDYTYKIWYPQEEVDFKVHMEEGKMIELNYDDGETFYISDHNIRKHFNLKDGESPRRTLSDTLVFLGVQKNQRNWKEVVYPNFKIGYLNVSKERLAEFDSAVNSIKLVKVRKIKKD